VKAAREAGPLGRVISVEPHPAALELLEHNIRINGLQNIVPVGVALGSKREDGTLLFSPGSTGGTFNDSVLHSRDRAGVAVRIVPLDALMAGLGTERVDFLKVDVEGAEMEVLGGANRLLAGGMVDRVVVETHGDELVNKTMDFLTRCGFRAVAMNVFPPLFVGHPFPTVFALRVGFPSPPISGFERQVDEKPFNQGS